MELAVSQLRQFRDDGYLVLRQAVPGLLVQRAIRAINHHLGSEGMPPDELPRFRAGSYCPGLGQTAPLTDLIRLSPVPALVEQLLGPGKLAPVGGAQIALRFPSPPGQDAAAPSGHLDGIGTGLNGSPKGSYSRSFSALAVVLLSDLATGNAGNFTVWPGSHLAYEAYFKERGFAELYSGMPRIDLPHGPVMLTGQAGDVVISHHQIFHTAAPNTSPHVRYAAIFRLKHVDCDTFKEGAVTDIWHEWAGIQALEEQG